MTVRRICVVTGTRADYGLLRWLMAEILERPALELTVIATGSHLSSEFGDTSVAIENDGFTIDERVDILGDRGAESDTALGMAEATGRATIGIARALDRLAPDLVVVLGDRFEILAATQAAMLLGIPIAHIAGGEATEGAVDESIRHAVTKMSHLHFTAAAPYRDKVIRMGEHPDRVFDVGAVGLDNIERLPLLDRPALAADLGFDFGTGPLFVATFHPETLAGVSPAEALEPLFGALQDFPDAHIIFTKANADAGGREINRLLDAYVDANPSRMAAFTSLGQLRYLSALQAADVVIGNSSSGIIEAPASGTPTVNIGDRQKGRLRAPAVIDVANHRDDISAGITRALEPAFRAMAADRVSPFGSPGAAVRIADVLEQADLSSIRSKHFYLEENNSNG